MYTVVQKSFIQAQQALEHKRFFIIFCGFLVLGDFVLAFVRKVALAARPFCPTVLDRLSSHILPCNFQLLRTTLKPFRWIDSIKRLISRFVFAQSIDQLINPLVGKNFMTDFSNASCVFLANAGPPPFGPLP